MANILIRGEKMEMGIKMARRYTTGKVTKLGKIRDQKINIGNLNGVGRGT